MYPAAIPVHCAGALPTLATAAASMAARQNLDLRSDTAASNSNGAAQAAQSGLSSQEAAGTVSSSGAGEEQRSKRPRRAKKDPSLHSHGATSGGQADSVELKRPADVLLALRLRMPAQGSEYGSVYQRSVHRFGTGKGSAGANNAASGQGSALCCCRSQTSAAVTRGSLLSLVSALCRLKSVRSTTAGPSPPWV